MNTNKIAWGTVLTDMFSRIDQAPIVGSEIIRPSAKPRCHHPYINHAARYRDLIRARRASRARLLASFDATLATVARMKQSLAK